LMMGLSSGRRCAPSNVTVTGYRVLGSDDWFVHAPGSCRELSVLLHVDNRISSGNTGAAAGRSESVRFLRLWTWTLLSRCLWTREQGHGRKASVSHYRCQIVWSIPRSSEVSSLKDMAGALNQYGASHMIRYTPKSTPTR
jgi:hypothetical protein